MVSKANLNKCRKWFEAYIEGFRTDDFEYQRNIQLKRDHSIAVAVNIIDICDSLNMSQEQKNIAELIALFHDIGRFEQYQKYKTFVDRNSENHAKLGVKVLKENYVFEDLDYVTKELIYSAILFHNSPTLPDDKSEYLLHFIKLIRDADKLDILSINIDHYHSNNGQSNPAIELDLPDLPEMSMSVYNDLLNNKFVKTANINTLNDFKLLQMGWVFDINFEKSFKIFADRMYLERMFKSLPASDWVSDIYYKCEEFLKTKCTEV